MAICAIVAATGPVIAMATPENTSEDISGCYLFDENIYTSSLNSYVSEGEMPLVYGLDADVFIIADRESGEARSYTVEYSKTPVSVSEFSLKAGNAFNTGYPPPDLSHFKERYLLAVMSDGSDPIFGLYRMNEEIWLVELRSEEIWSICRLARTEDVTFADMERALFT